MWKLRPLFSLFFFVLICSSPGFVSAAQRSTSLWQTLSGDQPLVIAHGGFSGIFPSSSINAYLFALDVSLPTVLSWCDVQLTKDGNGICFPDLVLDNASDVSDIFHNNRVSTYLVNGVPMKGRFTVDFTPKDLQLVTLTQEILSRPPYFDGTSQILTVDDVATQLKQPRLWLNVQHDAFFSQHNLSMRSFVISVSRRMIISYISSPEVNFLKSIAARFKAPTTKLIFQFLGQNDIEPTTNQSYISLLKNLTFIKTFANGILVPKYYIWPVDTELYLLRHTSVVSDAHAQGLEVYASEFATDVLFAYDYGYDPVSEYLSYIDNGNFSVDGLVSDFPLTPSATVDCFSHMGKNETEQVKFLIISSEGSSGQYPGCTDLAYKQAIEDGADVIDCPVQMSQDAVAFCMGSINLIERTTAAQAFDNITMTIPENADGIFPFNLTWRQIQTLKPSMYNPYASEYQLYRNPRHRNDGNFVTLSDFLATAKNASSVSGILISIEHAAFLAQNVGLDVISAVVDALNTSGYNNQTGKKVYIQSGDSAVLTKFRKASNYELLYNIIEPISDVTNSTILEITTFASAVVLRRSSVFTSDNAFLTGVTTVVPKFQAFNVSTYVGLFRNEFVSQAWDFLSDSTVEINTHVSMGITGVVTEYPATSARFRKNRCLGYKEPPTYMLPIQPDLLLPVVSPGLLPPAEAPSPVLTEDNVTQSPLPPISVRSPPTAGNGSGTTAPGPTPPSGQCIIVANTFLGSLAIILVTFAVLTS